MFAIVAALTCALGAHAYDFYKDGIYYIIDYDDVVYVNEGSGSGPSYSGSVNIPSTVTYGGKTYTVKGISGYAFSDCTGLTSVTFPNTLTRICQGAFSFCTGLTSLTFPASVYEIGFEAFKGCTNLTSITCLGTTPPNFYDLDSETEDLYPFSDVTYTRATLYVPEGCKSAYQKTGYWKYWYRFSNIKEMSWDFSVDGFCYNYSLEYENGFGSENGVVLSDYAGGNNVSSVVIPSTVQYGGKTYDVIGIGECAFSEFPQMTSVTIPESIVWIGLDAFYACTNLSSVRCLATTPPAFCDYDSETEAEVFRNVTYSNDTLYVPKGCKSAYQKTGYWKYWYKFANIEELPWSFTVNGIYYAITGTNTVAVSYRDGNYNSYSGGVTIPSSVTYEGRTYQVAAIGDYAFNSCTGLTSVTIPNTVTSIGDNAFQQCGTIQSIVIPNSVTSIGNLAFMLCENITYMVIPNTVTTIGVGAFWACERLERVVIGSSVTSIGEVAFMECGRLNNVECLATTPPTMAASNVFDDFTYSNATLTVPGASLSAYQTANYWKNFTHIQGDGSSFLLNGIYYNVTGDNTVEVTYKDATYNSYNGNVAIPGVVSYGGKSYNVTAIGEAAFRQSEGLTSVVIPISVKEIGTDAFYYCTSLTSVVIPSSVTTIGNYAFNYCTSLTNMTIGSSVTSIGYQAFRNCPALVSVTCLATTPPTLASTTFITSQYSSVMLFVPKRALAAYQAANYWKKFTQMHPTLDYALNTDGGTIEFSSTGYYPWTNVVEDGRVYAVSGNKGAQSRSSTMTTTVTLPSDGRVTFAYKAWGEGASNDVCTFSVDGTQKFSYGNKQNNWINYSAQLSAGTHTMTWTYSKNSSVNPEGDYFAVDNVVITVNTIPGDADGDGVVTVGDVTAIIDMILSGVTSGTPGADVDGNGIVNIADVTALIDYILTGN